MPDRLNGFSQAAQLVSGRDSAHALQYTRFQDGWRVQCKPELKRLLHGNSHLCARTEYHSSGSDAYRGQQRAEHGVGVPLGSHCGGPRGEGSRLEVGFHSALTSPLTLAPVLGTKPSDASDTDLC